MALQIAFIPAIKKATQQTIYKPVMNRFIECFSSMMPAILPDNGSLKSTPPFTKLSKCPTIMRYA